MTSPTAKEVLAYCTSCRMDLGHTIVAMQGDRILRAMCRTCKKEHAYKAPKGITDPSQVPAKAVRASRAEKKTMAFEDDWKQRMSNLKEKPSKPYSAKGIFRIGDVLQHPMFGDGIVDKYLHPNKIQVVFRTEMKILICGGNPDAVPSNH